jgi:predicted DCC family thiol-disulfide oxidoreductase YuxK
VRLRHGVALLLLLLIAWSARWAWPTGELRDYGSFIASGRAGAQGLNPYGIYPLTFHVVLPGFDVWNPNLNPPVSVPVFALFDRVEPHAGFRAWWIFSLASYLAAVVLLWRRYARGRPLLLLWALALAGFWDTLALGQIYLPLVLASAGAWILLDRGRHVAAGVLIGIVVAAKPNFGPWPLLLLLAGHWRAPVTAALVAGLLSAIPLLTHGPEIYAQWIALVLSDRGRAEFLTNASLTGLASRLGAAPAGLAVSALFLAWSGLWAWRRGPDARQASALGIICGILASPIAWVHYTLFLLPVLFSHRLTGARLVAAALLLMPVPILLGYLDAPMWQQVTIGSAYNWAMLWALVSLPGATMVSMPNAAPATPAVVFYDGYCGLCDHFVRFLLTRDRAGRIRFATLQGSVARRELLPAGYDPSDLDTVLVIGDYGSPHQRVLTRSRGVLHALAQLGGGWRLLASVGGIIPTRVADMIYAGVARSRYRMFGRFDSCPLPRPEWKDRFLDETIASTAGAVDS